MPPDAFPPYCEDTLDAASRDASACRLCEHALPLGPRPIFRVSPTARLLIISQAPGTKVHLSGIPWNDASGDRLRGWLGMDRARFYDASRIAIVPTGLCYPGRLPNGGDAAPRSECAPLWLDRFVRLMPRVRLTLLIGSYAQNHRLGRGAMTERVRQFGTYGPATFPLPHPSWRTTGWEKRNPWFVEDLLPALRQAVAAALQDHPPLSVDGETVARALVETRTPMAVGASASTDPSRPREHDGTAVSCCAAPAASGRQTSG